MTTIARQYLKKWKKQKFKERRQNDFILYSGSINRLTSLTQRIKPFLDNIIRDQYQ